MENIDGVWDVILEIQKAGHLLAWADRRKAQKYTESKIIIVKDLVRILRLLMPMVDLFFV